MNADSEARTDEELAGLTQGGSLPAFEVLVHRYEARVYRFACRLCRHETDARDVTQEVFVKAYQKIGQFDLGRSFATWLFTIARCKCIDRARSGKPAAGEVPELPDYRDPAELLARRETWEGIWDTARQRLPELQFQALWLRYAEDLPVAEIARVLTRTRVHVKVLLFRGRAALMNEMAARETRGAKAPELCSGLLKKGVV